MRIVPNLGGTDNPVNGFLEAVQTAALDVDGVLGEISNEEGELANLRTSLQGRRDSTVAKLNAAALIAGSTAGAA